jgi:hypothetical protein
MFSFQILNGKTCANMARSQALAVARNDGMHQCVVWDGIEHWMEERSFDTLEPGLLVYPKYGNLFGGNRKGDKIGIAVKHR